MRVDVSRETVAVVLGCPPGTNGRPLPLAVARARVAAELYRGGVVRRILVLGGRGTAFRRPESAAIASMIRDFDVPRAALEIECRSRTTLENARAARRLLPPGARVLLVTQNFHAARATICFRIAGIRAAICPAPSPIPGPRRRMLRLREAVSWSLLPLHVLASILRP